MLSHEDIQKAVSDAATRFPLKKVAYFGSYADGRASEASDLDLLVEFTAPQVSLFMIAALKHSLEDELNLPVDVIHAPIPEGAIIEISRAVPVYG
jgi:predicted nucleotidyltransferase